MEAMAIADLGEDVPLRARAADCPIPLTATQRSMWNYLVKQDRVSTRMCAGAVRISGLLKSDLLEASLEEVVNRHESLRTRIISVDGVLQQHVDAMREYRLEAIDLSRSVSNGLEEAARLAHELFDEKIDLSVGPLFATRLLRLSDSNHVLILLLDHIVSDAVSNEILGRELWTTYHQLAQGFAPSLAPLPVQFADYAVWLERTHDRWRKRDEAYWRSRFADAPRIVIPRDKGLAQTADTTGAMRHFPFGSALSERLRQLAARERAPLAVVILAIYVVVMVRWCEQKELVLAFSLHGRHRRPELTNMIGFLASYILLRIELHDTDSFLEFLVRVSQEFSAASDHIEGDRLVEFFSQDTTELGFNWWPRSWTRGPVGHVSAVHGLELQPFRVKWKFLPEFAPFFSDTAAGIGVTVYFRRDCFATNTIERFGHGLRSLAEQFVEEPGGLVSSASLKMR